MVTTWVRYGQCAMDGLPCVSFSPQQCSARHPQLHQSGGRDWFTKTTFSSSFRQKHHDPKPSVWCCNYVVLDSLQGPEPWACRISVLTCAITVTIVSPTTAGAYSFLYFFFSLAFFFYFLSSSVNYQLGLCHS